MSNIIHIDLSMVDQFVEEGGKLVFRPEAEEAILELLRLEEIVQNALKKVREDIENAGMSIHPSFSGVRGATVRAVFRVYGEKYDYELDKKEQALPFLKETVTYRVQSKDVDQYVKKNGKLPDGIVEKVRKPVISLHAKKNDKATIESYSDDALEAGESA